MVRNRPLLGARPACWKKSRCGLREARCAMPRPRTRYSPITHAFPDHFPQRLERFKEESGLSWAEIVVIPGDALLRYTVPMPRDSPIPGRAIGKLALNDPVLVSVHRSPPNSSFELIRDRFGCAGYASEWRPWSPNRSRNPRMPQGSADRPQIQQAASTPPRRSMT